MLLADLEGSKVKRPTQDDLCRLNPWGTIAAWGTKNDTAYPGAPLVEVLALFVDLRLAAARAPEGPSRDNSRDRVQRGR